MGTAWKLIGATMFGLKASPQPGARGSVGGVVAVALIVYWVPVRPFAVSSWAKRIPGVRDQNRPADRHVLVQAVDQGQVVLEGLAEADSGIEP